MPALRPEKKDKLTMNQLSLCFFDVVNLSRGIFWSRDINLQLPLSKTCRGDVFGRSGGRGLENMLWELLGRFGGHVWELLFFWGGMLRGA